MDDRFASVNELLVEYAELETELADPTIHSDPGKARKLGKRYAALGPIVGGYRAWRNAEDDLAAGKEFH
jgi:peptide chain release factor 1